MSLKIKYINGDATEPVGEGNIIIVHICNDIGRWGRGFVMAISNKWSEPKEEYRKWFKSKNEFELGKVQFVQVEDNIWITNLIGQHKLKEDDFGKPPIRYEAIKEGLNEVLLKAKELNASVHMPRIGFGLAGGKWSIVRDLILKSLVYNEVSTTVYDFK